MVQCVLAQDVFSRRSAGAQPAVGWARAGLGTGRLGHRPAWSKAGLVTAGVAGHRGGVSISSFITCAAGSRVAQTSQKGLRLHSSESLRAACLRRRRFAAVSSIARGCSDPWVPQFVYMKYIFGDVMYRPAHWAHAGLGIADIFCQGRCGDRASLHSNMRNRQSVGTGRCSAPPVK